MYNSSDEQFQELTDIASGGRSTNVAKVCLSFGERTSKRGHFSRLFTNYEWQRHFEAMATNGPLLCSSSSSSCTESSESEDCDSEDSEVARNEDSMRPARRTASVSQMQDVEEIVADTTVRHDMVHRRQLHGHDYEPSPVHDNSPSPLALTSMN